MSYTLLDSFPPSLPPLVQAYLSGDSNVDKLYTYAPTMDGLLDAANKRKFPSENRAILCDVLNEQARESNECHKAILKNIDRLRKEEVYTVTTGHQVCLFGGPLFFFYKILSVVKLVDQLRDKGVDVVPVYWMATEDHDFEEVNHVYIGEDKRSWDTDQSGAVGHMNLTGVKETLNQVCSSFEGDHRYSEAINKLHEIYRDDATLGGATRELVQWVFGDLGVVVIDGDDQRLKGLFTTHMERDLESQFSSNALSKTSNVISKLDFETQISGRDINLFYLREGYRERLTKNEDGIITADGKHSFSESAVKEELHKYPERFSPNVVLRPLYQEVILPNIAYVGGPGETSYWLQLNGVFDKADVQMPVVLLRDMFLISNSQIEKKRMQLGVEYQELYQEKFELINDLIRDLGSHEHFVGIHEKLMHAELDKMIDGIRSFEPGLVQSAETEKTRILNRLDTLKKKMLRADRRNNRIIEQRIDAIKQVIEPNGAPQERIHNWLNYFNNPKQCQELLVLCSPLRHNVHVIQEH